MAEEARSDASALAREAASLGPWFHNVHLPDGSQTAPDHPMGDFPGTRWRSIEAEIPRDLTGWRCLDVGCNAGFHSLELAKRGATVVGLDANPGHLKQAEWAARQFGLESQITCRQGLIYDLLRADEAYDLVIFLGVFHHLRYPVLALDVLSQITRQMLVFHTPLMPGGEDESRLTDAYQPQALLDPRWPKLAHVEPSLSGEHANWTLPNRAMAELMLRSAGFRILTRPAPELFVCSLDGDNPPAIETWNAAEFRAATGLKRDRGGES
jgi:tRNA (mo5U34)-methyltransferase